MRTCPPPIIVTRRYRLCRTTVGVGEGGEGVEGEAAVGLEAEAEAEAWVGMHSGVQTRAWG